MNYEQQLKEKAARWADAMRELEAKKKIVDSAKQEANKAQSIAEQIGDDLRNCVGKNIQNRYFNVDGQVVIIEYRNEGKNKLSIQELI